MSEREGNQEKPSKSWIGVDIGGTKTAIVLSSQPPAMLERIEFPTLPTQGPERAIELIKQSIHRLIDSSEVKRSSLGAIGVSCGGPLDQAAGVIQAPPNLSTWVDVPITFILKQEFGLDCRMENDANAGAGVIADGRLLSGAAGQAGEIGHVRLSASGPVGYNKAGSVEGWVSGGGIAQVACREVEAAIAAGRTTALAAKFYDDGVLTAKYVAEAAQHGDELARKIIHDTGSRLGEALAILVDLFNPERIVIGGLAMRLGEGLLAPARLAMEREALPASANICQIVPAALGEQIGDVAAICVAMGI